MKDDNPVKSKRFLVFSNDRGTIAARIPFEFPDEKKDPNPHDSLSPIGIAYEHPHDVYGDGFNRNVVGLYTMNAVEESNLVGKLLTLCDATFTDKEQRKAFKDMVSQTVYGFNRTQEERVKQTYLSFANEE